MAGATITNIQLGDNLTATNNFVLSADAADGTMKLARGNYGGSNTDILKVSASGGDIALISTGAALTNVASINGGSLAGFRNFVINGGMQVTQRGNVAAVNGVFTYGGADRICTSVNALTSGTIQQITAGVSVGVSGFSHAVQATTSAAGAVLFETRIEAKDAIKLNGKAVTVSCKVYQDTGSNLDFNLVLLKPTTTTDTFSTETTIQSSTAFSVPSAVLTPISFTFTVLGASAASLGLASRVVCTMGSAVTSKYFTITDWQLEVGTVPTTFEFRPYSVELILCQRYYEIFAVTLSTASRVYVDTFPYKVEKLKTPTLALFSGTAYGATITSGVLPKQSARVLTAPSQTTDIVYSADAEL